MRALRHRAHFSFIFMKFILGTKQHMLTVYTEDGRAHAATIIHAEPVTVAQIKTKEKDGYVATQIGFKEIEKKNKIKKPMEKKPFRWLREFENGEGKAGDEINVSVFQEGDIVKVSGISKGKGFQGAVKRWGFHGRNATHGAKHEERTLGSVGTSFPERVIKGRKMAGRMGYARATTKNLKIVIIDKENNLLAIRGAVPGRKGTLLEIYEG